MGRDDAITVALDDDQWVQQAAPEGHTFPFEGIPSATCLFGQCHGTPYLTRMDDPDLRTAIAAQDAADALTALGWPVLAAEDDSETWRIGFFVRPMRN